MFACDTATNGWDVLIALVLFGAFVGPVILIAWMAGRD